MLAYLQECIPRHPLEDKWGTTADVILTAIARSTDLTLRGVRGILAEATFEQVFVPILEADGWKTAVIVGDQSYDFLIQHDVSPEIKIQVKLQRSETGSPKLYSPKLLKNMRCLHEAMWVVEVQKTSTGKKSNEDTRPYRSGDFDILAVNLHPSSGDWKRFVFTVGNWLLPRKDNERLIQIMQPVSATRDEYWTDDLQECINRVTAGEKKQLYT